MWLCQPVMSVSLNCVLPAVWHGLWILAPEIWLCTDSPQTVKTAVHSKLASWDSICCLALFFICKCKYEVGRISWVKLHVSPSWHTNRRQAVKVKHNKWTVIMHQFEFKDFNLRFRQSWIAVLKLSKVVPKLALHFYLIYKYCDIGDIFNFVF